ncbi:MAG TPA: type II secretion system protein [bacterium]|nr:type II secretion system protein [bacterium]
MNKKKKGFTLIELLVVIAIIGILSTLAVVSLQNARKSARDAKRIADVKQMQTALELYFNDWQKYPATASVTTSGTGTIASGSVYMVTVPSAPTPADGDCTATSNPYIYTGSDASYIIKFCLGNNTGDLEAGEQCASAGGILTTDTCSF